MKSLTARHPLTLCASLSALFLSPFLCVAQDSAAQVTALQRRTPQQMFAGDAAILQARGRDVVRAAEFYGIDLEQGSWTYQQSVCPLMPRHLIVNYTRRETTGAETQFAAVVPVLANEPVRVVPIQKNGLAPFAPAETSQNSLAVFNRVWSSEGGSLKSIEAESNWVTLSLCYAEMVGSHPLIVTAKSLAERNAGPPTLRYVSGGGAATIFNDIGIPSQTWNWTLDFDRNGVLRSVEREKQAHTLRAAGTENMTATTIPATVAPAIATPSEATTPPLAPAPAPSLAPAPPVNTVTVTATNSATNKAAANSRMPRILPDGEAPPGRIIPDAQEAPAGRFVPAPQELPPTHY